MSFTFNKVQSLMKEISNVPRRRSSMFEHSFVEEDEEEKDVCLKLTEWNQRWGKHNADSKSEVLIYTSNYVQKIKQDKELWKSSVSNVIARVSAFEQSLGGEMIEHYPFSKDQHGQLLTVDSKIDKYLNYASSHLKSIEMSHAVHEDHANSIQQSIELINKLIKASLKTGSKV